MGFNDLFDGGGDCCGIDCDPIPLPLTSGTDLHPSWLVDDLDNVTYESEDVVTVEDDTLRIAQDAAPDDAVNGIHVILATEITTVGSATYEGNRTIKFADHATEYTVVKHVGTTLTITPGLTQLVMDAVVIEDQTPLVSLGTHEAYYLRLQFKTSTGVVEIHQGSGPDNSLSVDVDNQTIDFNSEPTEDLPEPQSGQWHFAQFYVCPTHSMGEAQIKNVTLSAGATVVDDSTQTADNDIEIEITGEATISDVTYYPADVVINETAPGGYDYYDYYDDEVVSDCGRRDLFPCPWPFFKQADPITDPLDVELEGWDLPLDDGVPDPPGPTVWGDYTVWWPTSNPSGTSTMPTDLHGKSGCELFSWRQHVLENPSGNYRVSWSGGTVGQPNIGSLYYEAWVEYVRDSPTAAVPYPLPYGRANLRYRDLLSTLDSDCDDDETVSANLADAASVGTGTWTIEATLAGGGDCSDRDTDSTITWNHPA